MSNIRISHPYLQILPRDTFALHADVILPQHTENASVTLSCDELGLNSTQMSAQGVQKENSDELRFTFGVASFRSHSSYSPSVDERTFMVQASVLCVDETGGEDVVAETTFPLKMKML